MIVTFCERLAALTKAVDFDGVMTLACGVAFMALAWAFLWVL